MTTNPTPADELREAAQLLRKLGADATPGPWNRPLNTRYRCSVTGALPEGERGNWIDGIDPATGLREQVTVATIPIWSNGRHSRQRGGRDLEYIAAMHPGVGLALADWLDSEAQHRGAVAVGQPLPSPRYEHALMVARRVLGTTAQPDTEPVAEVVDESCGQFVPDTPRAPGLCASCGDMRGWHSLDADEAQQPTPDVADAVALCDVMFEDGRQCSKADGHRSPGSDDPHVPTPAGPDRQHLPCSAANLRRAHAPHDWEPQPGMDPVHCTGQPTPAS